MFLFDGVLFPLPCITVYPLYHTFKENLKHVELHIAQKLIRSRSGIKCIELKRNDESKELRINILDHLESKSRL